MERENSKKDTSKQPGRKINPGDIKIPSGFTIDVYRDDLTTPINMIFTPDGDILVADSGIASGSGKVLRLTAGGHEVLAEGFNPPLTGINYHNGNIYVSHRGSVTAVSRSGSKKDILSGLPSWGDHHNNQVVFGRDGKMYFGQGTATNSGVVGPDNADWVKRYPFFHDYPGSTIKLSGRNFASEDFLSGASKDMALTGAYSPFGIPSEKGEAAKGITKASGSIMRADPDGSNLQLVAWGLRNPFRLKFDRFNRLFAANHGMDVRGSRPVYNSPDEFQLIIPGMWYGWPDYTGGMPVTLPAFKAEGKPQPGFLLARHPMVPPRPFACFTSHAAIMGFDFDVKGRFGPTGDAYIAEFGSEAPTTTGGKPLPRVGHRVSRIDMRSGSITNFAINKSGYAASHTGDGGLERPIDVVIGPDGAMYIVDFGMSAQDGSGGYAAGTGVIWVVKKASSR